MDHVYTMSRTAIGPCMHAFVITLIKHMCHCIHPGHDGPDKRQMAAKAAFTLQVHQGEALPAAGCLFDAALKPGVMPVTRQFVVDISLVVVNISHPLQVLMLKRTFYD